jgi:hypothetical protein
LLPPGGNGRGSRSYRCAGSLQSFDRLTWRGGNQPLWNPREAFVLYPDGRKVPPDLPSTFIATIFNRNHNHATRHIISPILFSSRLPLTHDIFRNSQVCAAELFCPSVGTPLIPDRWQHNLMKDVVGWTRERWSDRDTLAMECTVC